MTHPIPSAALDDRLAVVGTSGSGKTYGAGSGVERLLQTKARVLIIDPLGVWWGLGLAADGKRPSTFRGNDKLVIFGGEHGDMPLVPQSGAIMGETIAGMAESCVLDLSDMASDAEQRRFVLALLQSLFRHKVRDLLHVVFDEADMWAPQIILDKDGEAPKLLGMMQKIVKRGRVFGFIPWLITQNPAGIAKSVLGQVTGLVAFSLTSSQDRDAIGNWVKGQANEAQWKEIWSTMPTLEIGNALVWLPRRKIFKTAKFPEKVTFDSSRAPKRGERVKAKKLKPINLDKLKERLGAVAAEIQASDPSALKKQVAKLQAELASAKNTPAPIVRTQEKVIDRKAVTDAEKRGFDQAKKKLAAASNRAARLQVVKALEAVGQTVARFAAEMQKQLKAATADLASATKQLELSPSMVPAALPTRTVKPASKQMPATTPARTAAPADVSGLTNPQLELLKALRWWQAMGNETPSRRQLAAICKWKPTGSNIKDRLSELKGRGLVTYPRDQHVSLTDAGAALAPEPDATASVVGGISEVLTGPQSTLFKHLLSIGHVPIERAALAEAVGWQPNGSNIKDRLSELKGMEIVRYPEKSTVQLEEWVR